MKYCSPYEIIDRKKAQSPMGVKTMTYETRGECYTTVLQPLAKNTRSLCGFPGLFQNLVVDLESLE